MDQHTLEKFATRLKGMAAEIRASIDASAGATAAVELDTSIGRLSRMDAIQSQQMAIGLQARQRQALVRIQNALDAIRKGAYGQCRRCKGPIDIERLEAQPDALFCVRCAAGMSTTP